ncbi:MCE family protein [Nocardia otitidiscaviarum]|uniref:MlaD family protein n=1 Tax=Nocardia otitidiscaviarum TaxID=1823 RepID=UPI0004A6CE88|nr:MlaD family protein [Nocardia otitidiscaviarum]MBF6133397.1 MCE family protein [Nocardia otitidiscaviarum]MBF6486793.1 MCE family protein [Nocardia otitidiscaviarum]
MTAKLLRRTGIAVLAAALLAGVGGCGFDPASVPVPGTTVSGPTYRLHIEFDNVLNLPAKAKVIANGAMVGTVAGVRVVDTAQAPAGRGGYVVVDVDISRAVRLPATTVAELRQNTVLGDIHLALTTPTDGFGDLLSDGATIPLERTAPPVQLEDTMAALATFTQGGAIDQLQDIIHRFNAVLPQDPAETKRIAQVLAADAVDLAANLDQVDLLLNGLGTNAQVLHEKMGFLDHELSQVSVDQMNGITHSIDGVAGLFTALGTLGTSLTWLAPIATSGDAAAQAFVPLAVSGAPLDLSAPGNLNLLIALLRDKVIPFFEQGAKVNVTGVSVDSVGKDEQVDRMVATLRMIGAVR